MVQINQLYPRILANDIDSKNWLNILVANNKYLDAAKLEQALILIEPKLELNEFANSLEIATILADLNMDTESVLVGLLLATLRHKLVSVDKINTLFNKQISTLYTGVIKMDAIKGIQDKLDVSIDKLDTDLKADQIRKMLIAMVKDPRVVVIRLAEHLSELRQISKATPAEQKSLAKETKLIYAPLANRLGIGQIKWQLEDYAFRYLSSDLYKNIAKLLAEKRIDRDNYINNLIIGLKEILSLENITAEVTGRVKHIYSIWRKMQRKHLEFEDLYDIRAVRILTDSITDCYAALGLVHSVWQHIPKEFDDYIATPKENGYQSLHTAVIGPEGKTIEIQIRTHEMHNDSELGVAAHWRYKEGVAHDKGFDSKIAWLRQLIEWQDEVSSTSELLEELKTDISEDRVYVLTPKGDVFDLPEGATSLDLAYLIHTEVGNKCCGAKVNGKMVPLTHTLATGDRVEILTRNNSHPSRDWLNSNFNFIKTPRARAKIQSWFKKQDYDRNVIDGKEILERELQRLGETSNLNFEQVLKKLNFKTDNDIFAAIACGDVKLNHVLSAAGINVVKKAIKEISVPIVTGTANADFNTSKGIHILGVDNLLTSLAKCCKPIPGNTIVGYVSQGRGITVHCEDCLNLDNLRLRSPERLVTVSWGHDAGSMRFAVDIYLQSRNRHDLLKDVTGLLAAEKINILHLSTSSDRDGIQHTHMSIEVSSLGELTKLLDRMKMLPNVLKAERVSAIGN